MGRRMRCKETATSSDLNKATQGRLHLLLQFPIHSVSMMLSILAFILLLNVVLASPSPRLSQATEYSVSVSNISGIHEAIEVNTRGNLEARQTTIDKTFSIPIKCTFASCFVEVGIGIPPTNYSLIVDTGSPVTWVGSNKQFVATSSAVSTGQSLTVEYGTGNFSGFEFTLAPGLVVSRQSIGVGNPSPALNSAARGADGILGIGPADLTQIVLSSDPSTLIFTVIDNLQRQGTISSRTFSILSQPIGLSDSVSGVITVGGTDSTNLTSEIELFPITQSTIADSDRFWALDMGITYGTTNLLSNGPVLLDTGATGILLASDIFVAYQKAMGAVRDKSGLLRVTLDQAGALQPLNFTAFQNSYSLSVNAQIRARAPEDDPNEIFLLITTIEESSDQTYNAVLGSAFSQYFYTAYDSDNRLVGMANTVFTDSAVN